MVIFYANTINFDKIILSFSRLFYLRALQMLQNLRYFSGSLEELKRKFKKMPLQCHAEGMTMFLDM